MAVTWDIVALDATKTVGSLSDVVTHVHWTAYKIETISGVDYKAYRYGSINLDDADASSYIAYSDITKDNAMAWAKTKLGTDQVKKIEDGIANELSEIKTPTKTSGVPW